MGRLRRDFACINPAPVANRGLYHALGFNHAGEVQLGCKQPSKLIPSPPACLPYT